MCSPVHVISFYVYIFENTKNNQNFCLHLGHRDYRDIGSAQPYQLLTGSSTDFFEPRLNRTNVVDKNRKIEKQSRGCLVYRRIRRPEPTRPLHYACTREITKIRYDPDTHFGTRAPRSFRTCLLLGKKCTPVTVKTRYWVHRPKMKMRLQTKN